MHSLTETHTVAVSDPLRQRSLTAKRITAADEAEVLGFLAERPLETFGLLGMITENGLTSPYNRGIFYAYRGAHGGLEGAALIGYNTVIDARSEEAVQVFADLAKEVVNPFLILAPEQQIDRFIEYYANTLYKCTMIDRYWLFNRRRTSGGCDWLPGVRLATLADLEMVARAHNRCGIEETGIDALEQDAEGFISRCARRIERGRTWVWMEGGRLIVKLDVITATREVAYVESFWVHPDVRGKGYGSRFVNYVSEQLLQASDSVCLLAQEANTAAYRLYEKIGYEVVDCFRVIFCNKDLTA